MPSRGDTIKRAVSAPGTWRRLKGVPDLFASGRDAGSPQGSCWSPRALRTAARSQQASAERTAATTATPAAQAATGAAAAPTPRGAQAARPNSALSPRFHGPPSDQPNSALSPRHLVESEQTVPEVMPVRRDAHFSQGIWREMPTFSRWGRLDSVRQPSIAVSVACINKPEQAAPHEQVGPYPGFVPDSAELPEERQQAPTSARAYYLKEMNSDGARFDTPPGDPQTPDQHSTRPRGLSPRQRSASWASGGGRGRRRYNGTSPWQCEEDAILKSPREPTQSMSSDAGPMPAGMHHQAGWAAAALERAAVHAAGYKEPMEPLQLATGRSDDLIHPTEGSCVTPRNFFCPPSRNSRNYRSSNRTGSQNSPNKSFSNTGSQCSHSKLSRNDDDDCWPGTSSPGPELDLPGLRRARAASSGYSRAGPRRPARWRV